MRIGMMTDTYKPHVSGITNHIALNKRYMEQAGHDVYIFTFGDLDYEDEETNVIRSPGMPLMDTGYYLSLRYSLEAKQLLQTMDIVHVHHPFLSGMLALRYCHTLGVPIIFTNHTRYDLYAQAYLPLLPEIVSDTMLETYMPPFCKAVDLVISPSTGMAKVLRQLGVKSHIEVVPNGVELRRSFEATPLSRAEFGYTDEDILLIYTGRLGPEKNLPFLIRAAAGVAEATENVHLLIVGDGPEKESLQKLAHQSGQSSRIRFTGMVPYEQMPSYLAMCDIFVTASVTEVHPLSVIEAMGAGLPVIGVESVGVGDTVEDGETGFLSSPEPAAFAAKLMRLCLDRDLRQRMATASRQKSAQYSIERATQLMLTHYERLAAESLAHPSGVHARLLKLLEQFRK
ncbi:MAG: glycosyltransferase family 4 protein [Chloroflexi bacterium]|nr:glycosyltransferase family 4 protein [Chloroflexota bacterium]